MPETPVITESLDLLSAATAMISDANRQASTPCTEWTVTQVLQHAAGDQLAWAAALGVGGGPSENPFAPSGQLDGSPRDLLDPALAAQAVIEPLRQYGAYAAALPPQPGDGPAAELLRYLGRDPTGRPPSDNSKRRARPGQRGQIPA
jgi:hypothetical protein